MTAKSIQTLRFAICNLIIGVSVLRLHNQKTKFSFLIHTDPAKQSHSWQCEIVNEIIQSIYDDRNKELVKSLFKASYENIIESVAISDVVKTYNFENVFEEAIRIIQGEMISVAVINSENEVEKYLDDSGQLKLRTPINIFIGGQCLDRGITISNLVGFYYGRKPKKFQQDTVLQHSRMFGYRNKHQLAITRFYTEQSIFDAMTKMHEFDCALRNEIKNNPLQEIRFIQRDENGIVIPCSPNKLLISDTTVLKPYKRILPVGFTTAKNSIVKEITKSIDNFLSSNSLYREGKPFKLETHETLHILKMLENCFEFDQNENFNFDWEVAKTVLIYLSSVAEEKNKVWCTFFTNRDMSKTVSSTSHTVSSYSDAPDSTKVEGKLRKEFNNLPMLLLLKQNGTIEKGWKGIPFYWPIISAQGTLSTAIFANTVQSD